MTWARAQALLDNNFNIVFISWLHVRITFSYLFFAEDEVCFQASKDRFSILK